MSEPSFYILSEGQKNRFSSHDTSRAGFHHQDLATFSEDVNNAARRAFPNRGRSRYETVNACLIRWEDDELGVQQELGTLNNILQEYGFQTNVFLIPSLNSHWDLMRRTLDFIQACDNDKNLFLLYYAGHGRINSARQAEWVFGQCLDSPFVDWSAIQGLFGSAKSDVLILLDTCAAASSATISQFAVMETIAACGFERRAPPPGEHSLTNTLIDVLRDWINKPSFSAASLHTEILFRLKLKEKKKGREGIPLEWCVTPVHWINTKDCRASGIEICRRNILPSLSATPPTEPHGEEDSSTFVDAMDIDFDDPSSTSTPLSSTSSAGSYKVPHVLISLQLEENQPLDARQCARWLDNFPLLAKWVKVEAVFPSYSTLMILSVPMPIWDMLPDHPACSFIGYVTSPKLGGLFMSEEAPTTEVPPVSETSGQACGEMVTGDNSSVGAASLTGKGERNIIEDVKDGLLLAEPDVLSDQTRQSNDKPSRFQPFIANNTIVPHLSPVSRNPLLPSKDQCLALTDEQCRRIQAEVDPYGIRASKNWEFAHQPTLIRLYMTAMSFPQIADAMKDKLFWSYKAYENRYRDWLFPLDYASRQQRIIELYALVSNSNNFSPVAAYLPAQSRPTFRQAHSIVATPLQMQSQTSIATPEFPLPVSPGLEIPRHRAIQDRRSIFSSNTWSSGSAQSVYTQSDDVFSNPRLSVITTNSSLSDSSQFSVPIRSYSQRQRRPLKPPKHDPKAGLWNASLRVIPCGIDHSQLLWDKFFISCAICGFSQWHALMLHARSMNIGTFIGAMSQLRDIEKADFAGNYPIHFLMVAGVSMEYYSNLVQLSDSYDQNVFGQNPLHVLNPQDLEEELISFLEWFKDRRSPSGLLLTQRDIYCHTPLHTLLQHPLERSLYQKILNVFPYAEHQLWSLDNSGRSVMQLMNKASLKIKSKSPTDFAKIQAGLSEVRLFLSLCEGNQTGNANRSDFSDIARGIRGLSYLGFFECRVCKTNTHTNSYLDLIKCACASGRDRNDPDDTGTTPAHAIVANIRCNNDYTPETASQTAELFRVLIPADDPGLREALHVLDPEGKSLVFNVATRGFDEILEYILSLENRGRRSAMANACARGPDGKESSVLQAVRAKLDEVIEKIDVCSRKDLQMRNDLCEQASRLKRCKHILMGEGAVEEPSVTTRWKIFR